MYVKLALMKCANLCQFATPFRSIPFRSVSSVTNYNNYTRSPVQYLHCSRHDTVMLGEDVAVLLVVWIVFGHRLDLLGQEIFGHGGDDVRRVLFFGRHPSAHLVEVLRAHGAWRCAGDRVELVHGLG